MSAQANRDTVNYSGGQTATGTAEKSTRNPLAGAAKTVGDVVGAATGVVTMPVDATAKVISDGTNGTPDKNQHINQPAQQEVTTQQTGTSNGTTGGGGYANYQHQDTATGSAKDAMHNPLKGAARAVGDAVGAAAGVVTMPADAARKVFRDGTGTGGKQNAPPVQQQTTETTRFTTDRPQTVQ